MKTGSKRIAWLFLILGAIFGLFSVSSIRSIPTAAAEICCVARRTPGAKIRATRAAHETRPVELSRASLPSARPVWLAPLQSSPSLWFGETLFIRVLRRFFLSRRQFNAMLVRRPAWLHSCTWRKGMSLKKYESTLAVINHRRAQLSPSSDEELAAGGSRKQFPRRAIRRSSPPSANASSACGRSTCRSWAPWRWPTATSPKCKPARARRLRQLWPFTPSLNPAAPDPAAGCHVLTANDYLARRDAEWMGGIYRFLGLSVGYIAEGMTAKERRRAYACNITYATANEVGFDYLRDSLVFRTEDPIQTSVRGRADR